MDLLTRVKTLLGSKTQDNEGWIRKGKLSMGKNLRDMTSDTEGWFRQGKFTPGKQIETAIPGGFEGAKQRLKSTSWKQYTPMQLGPDAVGGAEILGTAMGNRQAGQDVGHFFKGANNLTPWSMASKYFNKEQEALVAPTTQRQQNAQRLGKMAYGTALTSSIGGPNAVANIVSRILQGATLGAGLNTAGNIIKGNKLTDNLGESALKGMENSWQLAFTNLAADKIAGAIPFLRNLTPESMKAGSDLLKSTVATGSREAAKKIFTQNAAKIFQRALLETPIENTWFTALNKLSGDEKRGFVEAWMQDIAGTAIGNLLFAGLKIGKQGVIDLNKPQLDEIGQSIANTAKKYLAPRMRPGFAIVPGSDSQPNIKVKPDKKGKLTEPYTDSNGEVVFPDTEGKIKIKGNEMTSEEAQNAVDLAEFKANDDPKTFDKLFAEWVGQRDSARTKGTIESSRFTQIPGNPEDLIKSIEGGKVKLTPEQQKYTADLRQTYDDLYQRAKDAGIDMKYLENYITHIWDRPTSQVAQDYQTARQTFKFSGNRSMPTYEEGIKMGLKPKYDNPAQILESYVKRLNETIANIDFFNKLKQEGLVVSGSKVSGNPDFAPINAPGFPRSRATIGDQQTIISNWFAPRKIADQVNRMFTPQDYGTVGKVAKVAANVSGGIQDITLSGGLPKTPLNAWSVAQVTKEILSGRIVSPLTSMFRSLSGDASNKFFEENADQIVKMQERNVPIRTTFSTENLMDQSTAKKLFGDSIGSAWNKIMNEPTFRRFMPQLEISFFNDIEAKLLKQGVDPSEAANTAAEAVKNFYGIVGSDVMVKRSSLGKDLLQAGLFAPRYRESMINFWVNNIKALKNPLSAENITNTKFTIGAILAFAAMNVVNKKNTGKDMWENPEGKEDKMLIKTKDGYIGVPFLSSIATIPRLVAKAGKHLVSGNLPQVVKDMKTALSSGVRPIVDIFTNEDYFGGEIYDPNATNKWGDIGMYLAGQYNHPYIREIMNTVGQSLSPEVKKKLGLNKQSVPAYQTFSKALELPFRFYNNKVGRDALSGSYYYESKDEALKELSSDEKNIYTTLEQKRPDDIAMSADIQMDMAEALTLLANPSVMRAKAKTAIDTAAKTGETLDPFYSLTPEQQQTVLRLKTFYPGDKEKTNLTNENIDWLKPYWTARSAFFDELETKGIIAKQEESEEYASPEMQKKLDYYYSLPYGTGARTKFINSNPDLIEYWDRKREITNQKRAELGLSQLDGFTKYAKKPKKTSIAKPSTVKLSKLPTSKAPSFGKLGTTSYKVINKPKLQLSTPKKIVIQSPKTKSNTIKIKPMPTMKVAKGGFLG